MRPLDDVLNGVERDIATQVYEGSFYECRNGSIVGPMIDDGCEPSFGYAASLGGKLGEMWLSEGWSRDGNRDRDLIREVHPPLIWSGQEWIRHAVGVVNSPDPADYAGPQIPNGIPRRMKPRLVKD